MQLEIRDSRRANGAIESLYAAAFPEEDLLPLVQELLSDPAVALSLVGTIDTRIVGHAIFSQCGVAGDSANAALLGPLAVLPEQQRQGVGSAIVRAGVKRLEDMGVERVFVLGDPAYYGRFGFHPESMVEPPYAFPADLPPEWAGAWQSLELGENTNLRAGKLSVPPPWRKPALWGP